MKWIYTLIIILCVSFAYADVTITEESDGSKMVSYYSNNKMAYYIDGVVTNITDVGKGLITVFNPMAKTYFTATFKEMSAMAESMNEHMKNAAQNPQYQQFMGQQGNITIKKTGTKQIAGYKCEEFQVTSGVMPVGSVVCFSKAVEKLISKEMNRAKVEKLLNSMEMDGSDALSEALITLEEKSGYMMSERSTSPVPGMGEDGDMIVTSVSKKKINSSKFKTPSGYKKTTMQKAMGGY